MRAHHWKRLFYGLLGLNIVMVVSIFIFYFMLISDKKEVSKVPSSPPEQNGIAFQVTTNKEELNQLIHYYLIKKQKGSIPYYVTLTDEVEFISQIPILQEEVEVKLTFEPIALENGNIELRQKNLMIGKFKLPPAIVLQFIHNHMSLPKWIIIDPDDGKVYLALQQLKLKSDYRVAAKDIRLAEDQIIFTLHVPMK